MSEMAKVLSAADMLKSDMLYSWGGGWVERYKGTGFYDRALKIEERSMVEQSELNQRRRKLNLGLNGFRADPESAAESARICQEQDECQARYEDAKEKLAIEYVRSLRTDAPEGEADVEKAGEGSRGGHIIGHTKTGKPIYAHTGPKTPSDEFRKIGWTSGDHRDASDAHREAAKSAEQKLAKVGSKVRKRALRDKVEHHAAVAKMHAGHAARMQKALEEPRVVHRDALNEVRLDPTLVKSIEARLQHDQEHDGQARRDLVDGRVSRTQPVGEFAQHYFFGQQR